MSPAGARRRKAGRMGVARRAASMQSLDRRDSLLSAPPAVRALVRLRSLSAPLVDSINNLSFLDILST